MKYINKKHVGIVSIFLILSAVALSGCLNDDVDLNTPEERYKTYMDILNLEDGRAAVQMMDISLTRDESLDDMKQQIIEHIDGGGSNWDDHSIEGVRYEDDLDSEESELFTTLKTAYRGEPFELELQDYCMLDRTIVMEGEESFASLPMVKLKGVWYFATYQHKLPST